MSKQKENFPALQRCRKEKLELEAEVGRLRVQVDALKTEVGKLEEAALRMAPPARRLARYARSEPTSLTEEQSDEEKNQEYVNSGSGRIVPPGA